jgi:hypothetical protein
MRLLQAVCAVTTVGAGVVSIGALTTAGTGCSDTSQVRQVFMALDGAGNRPRTQFAADTTTLDCDVVWSGHGTDDTIGVQFVQTTGEDPLYNGTNNLQTVSRLWAAGEDAPGEGITTVGFTFNPPTLLDGGTQLPFPVGHYQCRVTAQGQPAGQADFDIVYPQPDCPALGAAYDGLPCVGYQQNAQCPNDDDYDPTKLTCTCQAIPDLTRVFQCQ